MIYIILPVHNRKNITELFIECLVKQTYKNFKIILVDDGSTDGTSEMVLSYFPESVIIKGDGNLWWAGALQKGYEWIIKNANDEDICLLINDDTIFDENFLDTAVKILSQKKDTLLLAQAYSKSDSKLLDIGVNADLRKLKFRQANNLQEINCLSTRGLFLRVKDFKKIGGFHPKTLPHYLSDYEFTIRAYKKGFKLITDENLKLSFDTETTGLRSIKYDGILDYYSKFFSNRNPSNPVHWLAFVWFAVPYPYKLYHLIRIGLRTFFHILLPLFKRSYLYE